MQILRNKKPSCR